VVRIDGPSVGPDVSLIAVPFLLFLAMVMAVGAERLQFAKEKQMLVTSMGNDVVRHGSWGEDLPSRAHGT
jgi:hypothetical protein